MTLHEYATDPHGQRVELTSERWRHVVEIHPEIEAFRDQILLAVAHADRELPGRRRNERWYYLENAGPSRWLKVVVAFEGGRGWIVTAFARRSFP